MPPPSKRSIKIRVWQILSSSAWLAHIDENKVFASTGSVGMNMARPGKAGIKELFLKRFDWSCGPGLKRPGYIQPLTRRHTIPAPFSNFIRGRTAADIRLMIERL